jgi:16S rRNA processing protein RimM
MLKDANAPAPLEVARVVRAHGLRGGVSVALHWRGSETLQEVEEVTLQLEGAEPRTFPVRKVSGTGAFRVLELVGIDDRNAAEALRGARVSITRAALPPLETGEYYLADLVGATVTAPDGVVGRVIEIALYPSVDSLVIETPEGERLEQPLIDHWLESVDVQAATVRLTSRDGLV